MGWRHARVCDEFSRSAFGFRPRFSGRLVFLGFHDRKVALKVLELVEAIRRDPFDGLGKPEPLRHLGEGVWSRRITQEHRLVYKVSGNQLLFAQARFHY